MICVNEFWVCSNIKQFKCSVLNHPNTEVHFPILLITFISIGIQNRATFLCNQQLQNSKLPRLVVNLTYPWHEQGSDDCHCCQIEWFQHGTYGSFLSWDTLFVCKALLKGLLGHRMSTKQCDGAFGLHKFSYQKVSARAVLTWIRTPSVSSLSMKCSVLELVVISWTNEQCCLSVGRSSYLDCWNRAMWRSIDWSL